MDARAEWSESRTAIANEKAIDRWRSFGPYYAMFPVEFARKVIATHTAPGDFVLDPFCGRGTSVFCAAEVGRDGLGIEINPVGWLYAHVKVGPSGKDQVLARLEALGRRIRSKDSEIEVLPSFFRKCFCKEVLSFLLVS